MMIEIKKIMLIFLLACSGLALGAENKFAIESKGFGIKISQNFPNPCNLYTTIVIDATEATKDVEITIKMCNISGKSIKNLSVSVFQGHRISRQISLNGISAGMYFCRIIANGKCIGVMRMLLIK